MKSGIIGLGVVGSAVHQGINNVVFTQDLDKSKCKGLVTETDILFICLPSPTKANLSQDLSALMDCFKFLNRMKYDGIIVVKTTVLPGTCDRLKEKYPDLRIVHNPEFLTAKNAVADFITQETVLLSGNQQDMDLVEMYFKDMSKCPMIKNVIKNTNYLTTEWAKYIHNCVLATKISLLNEFHSKMTQDVYNDAVDMAYPFGNLGCNHRVPGPDGRVGYAGACFPKDMRALLGLLGDDAKTLKGAVETNYKIRGL